MAMVGPWLSMVFTVPLSSSRGSSPASIEGLLRIGIPGSSRPEVATISCLTGAIDAGYEAIAAVEARDGVRAVVLRALV
jgi:hypothetical protein